MPPNSNISRPFSVLKELVDRGEVRLAPESDKPIAPPRRVDASLSEQEAFTKAMGEVRPLGWSKAPLRLPRPIELRSSDRAEGEKEALRRLADFVNGEGEWDPFATGEGIEGAATQRGRRYLGRLKNGEFSVQAHLDLHGLGPEEATAEMERFLRGAIALGHCCVRIVHGRGKHSSSEPAVLKKHVTRCLSSRKMSRWVAAFASARWTDGGSGAVYVLLYGR
ncbi:MAG TPA: Smr/MutS family protein [Vicinamibacteria bacterium]